MGVLVVLLLGVGLWWLSEQARRIERLQQRLQRLEDWAASQGNQPSADLIGTEARAADPALGSIPSVLIPRPAPSRPEQSEPHPEASPAQLTPPPLPPRAAGEPQMALRSVPSPDRSDRSVAGRTISASPTAEDAGIPWRNLERQLIDNGTGILGVVVLVAGITVLVVNLAMRFGPLPRFLLTQAIATALIAPSLLWREPGRWRPLCLWLRSGGAALALFACLAGGGLPQVGLQWLVDPLQGLLLALAGIALNLLLAVLTRHQTVASLHVLVCLVPLALVGQNASTLWIASLVGVCGQVLPRGRPWDRHRLLVNAGYSLFQLSWLVHVADLMRSDPSLRLQAILPGALMFGSAVLLQQRHVTGPRLTPWRLAALISGWSGLGLTLMLVPPLAVWRATSLLLLAAVALLLARQARRAGGADLHLSQLLVSQALVMAAVISLGPLLVDGLLVSGLLLLESVLFLQLSLRGQPPRVLRIGWQLVVAMALLVLLQATASLIPVATTDLPQGMRHAGLLIGAGGLLAAVSTGVERRGVPVPLPPLFGWLAGALVFLGPAMVPPAWRPLLALGGMGGLLLLERRWRPAGLGQATTLAVAGAHLAAWLWMLVTELAPATLLGQVLPLTGLALATRLSVRSGLRRSLALDLVGVTAGLAGLLLLRPVSPLLPGVAWLLMSLAALLASNRLPRREVNHGLVLGLVYLLAFVGAFVLVIAPSSSLVELAGLAVRSRLLIALLGLAVLLGWWLFPAGPALRRSHLWRQLHPWFVEFLLLGTAVTVAMEVEALLQPLAWSLLALALLSRPLRRWLARRVSLYAVFTYWLAILSTLGQLDASPPADASAQVTLVAILLQTLFALLCRRWLPASELIDPGGWKPLAAIGAPLARQTHRWLLYPLFVVVAVHLAQRYDAALLTLLWALQAFIIFVLSLVLRDNQFRLASLLALGACLLRLVSIDMAQADPVLRGLVFVGVGMLMVAMNAISTRFRDRFER